MSAPSLSLHEYLVRHTRQMSCCFYLDHFDFCLRYDKDLDCQMEIDTDYRYLEAEIAYGKMIKEFWDDRKFVLITKTLTHEICHVLTGQLSNPFKMKREIRGEVFQHFDEQVTEHCSRIAYLAYVHFLIQHPNSTIGVEV